MSVTRAVCKPTPGSPRPFLARLVAEVVATSSGLTVTALVFAAGWARAAEISNADCLVCHEDKSLTQTNAQGVVRSLYVDAARLGASVHRSNTCVNCHADLTDKHPDDGVPARPPAAAIAMARTTCSRSAARTRRCSR